MTDGRAQPLADDAPQGAEGVYRLLYVSDVAPHVAGPLKATLEEILVSSVRNNRRDGITGFLVCDGAWFAQALEGDRAAVEACFERIVRDRRNLHVEIRQQGVVEARTYPRWTMCGLTLSDHEDALLNAAHIDMNLRQAAPGALDQHMLGIAERHAHHLDVLHARLLAADG